MMLAYETISYKLQVRNLNDLAKPPNKQQGPIALRMKPQKTKETDDGHRPL